MNSLILMILFWIGQESAFAGFSELGKDNLYQYQDKEAKAPEIKSSVQSVKKSGPRRMLDQKLLTKLLDQDKEIADLLEQQKKTLIVKKSSNKITSLTRVEGVLLNSVLAMNVRPSKFLVRLGDGNSDLEGGEIRCQGMSFQKRINAKCDLLVLDDQEFKIDAEIWDLDGAEGIIADYQYMGEESAFLTSSLSSFFSTMLEGAKDRVSTPFGVVSKDSGENHLIDGLIGIGANAKNKIDESSNKKIEISYVNSGKRILVFFNSSLNLTEAGTNE